MTKAPPRWLVILVFALVVAGRIHYAWVQRCSTDSDRDIAQLMCKHVAEGREWPTFFYGQGYMGSLEPLIGALICKLFGTSAFHAGLGTALPAVGVAGLAWLIARAIAGPWAALYAAAFFVSGSPGFSAYMGNPRGGYAVVALLGTACLYLGARLAAREFRGDRPGLAWYALLGLVAGAAWWTSAIVVSALAAAALIIAIGQRGRILNMRIVAGVLGFLAGAAPWLIWNAQNEWLSMSMSSSLGAIKLKDSFPLMLTRLWEIAGLGRPGYNPYLLGSLLLIIMLTAVALPLRKSIRQRDGAPVFHLAALALFVALFIASYVSSSFSRIETLRYLLPLVPVLAILVGLALGAWTARLPLAGHLVLLCILMGGQIAAGNFRLKADEASVVSQRRAMEFGQLARQQGFDAVFAWYGLHWLNFGSQEAVAVVDGRGERYHGYARQGLLADQPAWLSNPEGVQAFLDGTASAYQTMPSPLGGLIYNAQPPSQAWMLLGRDQVAHILDQDGEDVKELVTDGNLATKWRGDSTRSSPAQWVIKLAQPTALRGLKLYSAEGAYPLYFAVDVRGSASEEWREVRAPHYVTRYHWSGALLYWQNLYYSMETRVAPVTASEVRLRFPPSEKRSFYRIRISELSLLAVDSSAEEKTRNPPSSEVDDLIHSLQQAGMTDVLADRWVSDRIAARTNHTLRVRSSADLTRDVDDPPQDDDPIYTLADLGVGTALLLPPGAVSTTEQQLRDLGFHPERRATSLGTLLMLSDPADAGVPGRGPVAWFGDAMFALREPGDELFYAHNLFLQAERVQSNRTEAALHLLEACLETDPSHAPALQRWLNLAAPDHPAYAARQLELKRLTQPAHSCNVRFSNGIKLLGCSVEPGTASPGQTVTVTFYWRAPKTVAYDDLNTFVHYRHGSIIWQDDHAVFAGVTESRIRRQPVDAPLRVIRQVTIPTNAPTGSYDLAMGLVRKSKAKRVLAWGAHAKWNRSVLLSDVLEVLPPEQP